MALTAEIAVTTVGIIGAGLVNAESVGVADVVIGASQRPTLRRACTLDATPGVPITAGLELQTACTEIVTGHPPNISAVERGQFWATYWDHWVFGIRARLI